MLAKSSRSVFKTGCAFGVMCRKSLSNLRNRYFQVFSQFSALVGLGLWVFCSSTWVGFGPCEPGQESFLCTGAVAGCCPCSCPCRSVSASALCRHVLPWLGWLRASVRECSLSSFLRFRRAWLSVTNKGHAGLLFCQEAEQSG